MNTNRSGHKHRKIKPKSPTGFLLGYGDEKISSAKACIRYLKRERGGRTIIPEIITCDGKRVLSVKGDWSGIIVATVASIIHAINSNDSSFFHQLADYLDVEESRLEDCVLYRKQAIRKAIMNAYNAAVLEKVPRDRVLNISHPVPKASRPTLKRVRAWLEADKSIDWFFVDNSGHKCSRPDSVKTQIIRYLKSLNLKTVSR